MFRDGQRFHASRFLTCCSSVGSAGTGYREFFGKHMVVSLNSGTSIKILKYDNP